MGLKEYLLEIRNAIIKNQGEQDINKEEYSSKSIMTQLLEKATVNFFPKNGIWYETCYNRPSSFNMDNLPCHLRDDKWLAYMLQSNQKLYYISYHQILNFVRTSKFFEEQRKKYEHRIIFWQINWMASGGENWICDEEYGGDVLLISENCDLGFRKGVVDTLTKIGMDTEVVEEGIEKMAELWRPRYMNAAFLHKFEYTSYFPTYEEDCINLNPIDLEQADSEHKEKWLKMREYEYYQRHKESVDKYGAVTPNMLMTDEEAAKLKLYLTKKNEERLARIEKFKNANQDRPFLVKMTGLYVNK